MTKLLLALAVWAGFALLCLFGGPARSDGAHPANVSLTCKDVVALVAWAGWDEIERRAREAPSLPWTSGADSARRDRAIVSLLAVPRQVTR
jgi:hypothetical protein